MKSYGWETGTGHFAIDGVTIVTAVTMASVYHQAAGKRYYKNESCNALWQNPKGRESGWQYLKRSLFISPSKRP